MDICFTKVATGATHRMEIKQTLKKRLLKWTGTKLNTNRIVELKMNEITKTVVATKSHSENCEFLHYLNNMFSTLWLKY